jgi:hypothetical protein
MMGASGEYGSNGPGSRDPETIARAIDETRGEVDETLDALQVRLSPGELLDRAVELMRDSGGQFANNLARSVRDNPLPLILTGVGLVWMISVSRSSPAPYAEKSGRAAEAIRQASRGASDSVASAGNHIAGAAESLSDAVTDTAEKLSHGVDNLAGAVRRQSRRVTHSLSNLLQDQPLFVGAMGLALGALIGYVLPASEVEDSLFGEARDAATQRAAAAASTQFAKQAEGLSDST